MLLKGMDHVSTHLAGCSPRPDQGTIESKSDFLSGWKQSALGALVSNLVILQQDAEGGASVIRSKMGNGRGQVLLPSLSPK